MARAADGDRDHCVRGSIAHAAGSVKTASNVRSALRALLVFLHLRGDTPTLVGVGGAVGGQARELAPVGARRRPGGAAARKLWPRQLRWAVESRGAARLLARLGLRAGEIASVQLDDVEWRAGEIVVVGRGRGCSRTAAAGPTMSVRRSSTTLRRPPSRVLSGVVPALAGAAGWTLERRRAADRRASRCARGARADGRASPTAHGSDRDATKAGASLPVSGQVLRHRRLQ